MAACLLMLAPIGCAGISAHEGLFRNAIADRRERAEASRGLSGASNVVLVRHGLLAGAADDPAGAARALEAKLRDHPEPDGALALAELSYHAGLLQPAGTAAEAMGWHRDAAALSALALADPNGTRPDLAVRIHNGAVARLIRGAQEEALRDGRKNWRQVLGEQGLALNASAPYLDPRRIADLYVSSDLTVEGMDHVYRATGLGVPLVAHRLADPSRPPEPRDRFLPRELRTGATAVLLPGGGLAGGDWRRGQPTLSLFDPFVERSVALGPREVNLAEDRTTPLAAQVSRAHFASLEWTGLLTPDFRRPDGDEDAGLYMLRPYEPGKIPVVFVHGLISSPRSWAQTINELRNTPDLASRYQFWVFLYPTGLPIPASASRLREALTHVRNGLDPTHADAALDRMMLVGHSMGGILSKMMVQDSGTALWDSAIAVPRDQFRASPELLKALDEVLIYRPLPFVRRVVFIASPHRGSPLASDLIGRIVERLVRPNGDLAEHIAEIEKLNGPNVLSPEIRGRRLNAIGNLRADSPILTALSRIPIDPRVPYHSIIPLIGGVARTDGVVEYRSSHLDGAESERIVSGTHSSQQKPEVTRELRRILREHLEGAGPLAAAGDGP